MTTVETNPDDTLMTARNPNYQGRLALAYKTGEGRAYAIMLDGVGWTSRHQSFACDDAWERAQKTAKGWMDRGGH